MERAEASTRSEVERTRKQLVDSYRELGARTADFEVPDREAGLRFLKWFQEELLVLPTIVEGFMSYASLVTCEGAMNALSREGCRQSGAPPDSPVNYSRTPPNFPESGLFTGGQPGALDTVWCTTVQSGVPDCVVERLFAVPGGRAPPNSGTGHP